MGQTVSFEVSTEHARAISGFLQVQQAAEAVGRIGDDVGNKMKEGGDKAGDAYSKTLAVLQSYPAAFAKMLTGGSALYMMIAQISREYERVVANRAKAMEGLDEAHEPYKRLTMQVSQEFQQSPKFKDMVRKSITGRGDAPNALSVLANAFSAAGANLTNSEVADAGTLLNQLAGAEGMTNEDTEQLMTSMILTMQADRRRGKKTPAKQVLGTILSEFPLSTAVDMGKLKYQMQFENPLVEYSGYSREEAGALSSALGQAMGDPEMRRTRTSGLLLRESLSAAYQWAHQNFGPYVDSKGREMSIEEFDKAGLQQIEIARSKTETGLAMRAFLAPRTEEEREMSRLLDPSGMHRGALQGEAGGKEVGRALLDTENKLWENIQNTIPHVKTGKAAEQAVDARLNMAAPTRQDELYRLRTKTKGAIAAAKFENTTMAQQGAFNELVQELGDIENSGALQQTLRGIDANLQSTGKTPAEIEELQRQAVRDTRSRILYGRGPMNDAGFHKWAYENRRHTAVPLSELGAAAGYVSQYPPSVYEEYRRATMPADQRGIVEAFDTYLSAPVGRATSPAGAAPRGARSSNAPVGSDTNAELLQKIGELTAVMHGIAQNPIGVNVNVQDGLGRQIGRSTSRARALEQFNDPESD